MKMFLFTFCFLFSSLSFAGESCQSKVKTHYKKVYHDTYKAASNTFLNNFIGKKNATAHMLAYPKIAFLGYSFTSSNYQADRILRKTKTSGESFLAFYESLLSSGEFCEDLKEDYKKVAKVRKYLISKYKEKYTVRDTSIVDTSRESFKEVSRSSSEESLASSKKE